MFNSMQNLNSNPLKKLIIKLYSTGFGDKTVDDK